MPKKMQAGLFAGPAGKGRSPGGRREGAERRRACHRGHQPRSRRHGRGIDLPRRSLLSAARHRGARAAAARAARRSPGAHRSLPRDLRRALQARRKRRSRATRCASCPRHSWPGNVRQLENVLLNAWVLSDRPELLPDDFDLPVPARRASGEASPPSPRSTSRSMPPSSRPPRSSKKSPASKRHADEPGRRRDGEKERILSALRACNWNRVKAAHMLGLPRRTFYRRLKEHGIQ